jgi:fido (protein-threonine AMPylation protein)
MNNATASVAPSFPPWKARAECDEAEYLFNKVWSELRTSCRDKKLEFLTDTRSIHETLFRASTPVGYDFYAGHYRGEKFPGLETRIATMRYRSPIDGATRLTRFTDPKDVQDELTVLKTKVVDLQSKRMDELSYFIESVSIFRRFSTIHPYLNGNGRISRLMLALLAEMKGIRVKDNWTYHIRPYGNFMGIYFQEYPKNPHTLVAYLLRWFG